MLSFCFKPYTWDVTKERVDSDLLSLKLKGEKNEQIKISNLSEDIIIVTPLTLLQNFTEKPWYFTRSDDLRIHVNNVKYENTLLMLDIKPQNPTVHLFAYLRFGHRPTVQDYELNTTISHNEKCVWILSTHGRSEGQTVCSLSPLAPIKMMARRPGKYFLGLKNYNATTNIAHKREKTSCFGGRRRKRSCIEVKDPPSIPAQSKNVSVIPVYDSTTDQNYTLKVSSGSCVYWSEKLEMWMASGCQVSV